METIIAAFKAIPKIVELVDKFIDLWLAYQERQVDVQYDEKRAKRLALGEALKFAKDDETRKAIARELHGLNKV